MLGTYPQNIDSNSNLIYGKGITPRKVQSGKLICY